MQAPQATYLGPEARFEAITDELSRLSTRVEVLIDQNEQIVAFLRGLHRDHHGMVDQLGNSLQLVFHGVNRVGDALSQLHGEVMASRMDSQQP